MRTMASIVVVCCKAAWPAAWRRTPSQAPAQTAPPSHKRPLLPAGFYAFLNTPSPCSFETLVYNVAGGRALAQGTDPRHQRPSSTARFPAGWARATACTAGAVKEGTPRQGYQLPLLPPSSTAPACRRTRTAVRLRKPSIASPMPSARLFLVDWSAASWRSRAAAGARFLRHAHQNVMYGISPTRSIRRQQRQAGWKLIVVPGVIAVHYSDVREFRGKKYR